MNKFVQWIALLIFLVLITERLKLLYYFKFLYDILNSKTFVLSSSVDLSGVGYIDAILVGERHQFLGNLIIVHHITIALQLSQHITSQYNSVHIAQVRITHNNILSELEIISTTLT